MGILKLHSFLLLHLFLPIISTATNCTSTCGSQTISFPFRLDESPSFCGYPGFNLACKVSENQTVLSLPGSGDFLAREINYTAQTIRVYDPGNCLPNRLIGFNLSGSPFLADLSTNYTLFSCPKQFEVPGFPFTTIACLENSTRSVLAIRNGTSVGSMVPNRCKTMDTLMVPGGNSPRFFMDDVLELTWDEPKCQVCEGSGGYCGSDDQNQIVCYFDQGGSEDASTNDQIFKIIALSITIPAMLCSVSVGIFLCTIDSRGSRSRAQQVAVTPQHELTIDGLDQATIDSYTKVVLGESKRVPGPNKDMCPICLSDFNPTETLKCIPECQHSFHADCIDEWLRIKGSCPLCRKMPSPVHESS